MYLDSELNKTIFKLFNFYIELDLEFSDKRMYIYLKNNSRYNKNEYKI